MREWLVFALGVIAGYFLHASGMLRGLLGGAQ